MVLCLATQISSSKTSWEPLVYRTLQKFIRPSKCSLWWQMLILKSSTLNFRHQLQAYHIIQRSSCLEESHVKSCPGDFPSTWAVSAEPSVSLREARSDLFYAEERVFLTSRSMCTHADSDTDLLAASERLKNLTRRENSHIPARFHQCDAWHQMSVPLCESLEEWCKTFSLGKYIIQKQMYLTYRLQCD